MAKNKKTSKLSKAEQKYVIRRLLGFAKRFIPLFVIAFIFAAVSSLMAHYIPVLVGEGIDLIIEAGKVDFEGIGKIVPVIFALAVIGAALDWFVRLIATRAGTMIVCDIRSAAVRNLQRLPVSYFDSHASGDVLSRIIADTDRLSEGLLTGLIQLYSSVLGIVITLVFMIIIDWKVALIVAILTPMSMFVAGFIASRTFSLFKKRSATSAEQTAPRGHYRVLASEGEPRGF